MRRALALAAIAAFAVTSAAHAAKWTKYVDVDNGLAWSYDADYSYKDKATGRVVVMQAVSKPSVSMGPAGPGEVNGVGSVVALDCAKKNLISIGSYKPGQALAISDGWRSETPKLANGSENEHLLAAVCPMADKLPVK